MYSWDIGVARSIGILEKLGIVPRKTKIINIPDLDLISLPDYLRGLFDGDGCWHNKLKKQYYKDRVYKRRFLHFNFTTGSKKMAESIIGITNKITGSSSNIIEKNTKYDSELFHSKKYTISYECLNARKLAKFVYQNPNPCLTRKINIVKEFVNI